MYVMITKNNCVYVMLKKKVMRAGLFPGDLNDCRFSGRSPSDLSDCRFFGRSAKKTTI